MKVLHVTPYFEPAHVYGGPVTYLGNLCRGLAALGAEVTVYTTSANGNRELESSDLATSMIEGVDVRHYPRARYLKSRFHSRSLGIACSQHLHDFDIVHISTIWTYPSNIAARISYASQVPYIVTMHGMLMSYALQHGRLKKRIYMELFEKNNLRNASILHCTSKTEESALRYAGVENRSRVVPCGVDVGKFLNMPAQGSFRNSIELELNDRLVLHLGRLHQIKGIDILLDAFERVSVEYADVHLVLAGSDEQNMGQRIKNWASARGLAGRVHLTGPLTESHKLRALADAEVVVMPSYSENFGMSAAEAMAAGVPVLVSSQAGISEWVSDFQAGIVTEPDSISIAQHLIQLLALPRERLRLYGEKGRKRTLAELSEEATTKRMLALYQEVIEAT